MGNGDEAHVVGFRVGSDEPEPLFGYDEGNDRVGGYGIDGVAEAHHGVDVAAAGDRQCRHVERGGWSGISEVHGLVGGSGRWIVRCRKAQDKKKVGRGRLEDDDEKETFLFAVYFWAYSGVTSPPV